MEALKKSFKERFSDAMADVAYLEKCGWNAHFKYSFVTEADVKKAASEAFRKHGLMVYCVAYAPIGECSGKAATVLCTLTVGDVYGTESVTAQAIGSGSDSSDKAPAKALAGSLKYCLTQMFLIATGDGDIEEDGGTAAKSGKEEPKKAASKAKTEEPANENGQTQSDPVADMIAQVEGCETLEALNKLKIAVSKLRNESGFEKLAEAFRAKGKALTTAQAGGAKEAA